MNLLHIIAQAGPDIPSATMISGEWVISMLVAVIGAVGMIWQRKAGMKEGKAMQGDITISGQPIAVRKEAGVPTWAEIKGIEKRVESLEKHMDGLRDAQANQFRQLLEAGHEREIRIRDTISASIGALGAKFSGDIRAVHERIEGCMAKHAKTN